MGMSDVTMSSAWKTYRQKLRDITKDVDTVDKVSCNYAEGTQVMQLTKTILFYLNIL